MSFPNSFDQWNKLDIKNQITNPTSENFSTVAEKIEEKGYLDIHLLYQ